MKLNPKQEKAKNKIKGPLLIIAGAGSGKTATLTARVEYMIREKNINPSEIMMVTFTNKAALEMRERVAKVLGTHSPRNLYSKKDFPLIGTFHSIGIFILKEILSKFLPEELEIGLKKNFVIYDESDKLSVLKGIIKNKLMLEEKEFPARQIAFYISNAKNNLITAKGYESEVDSSLKEVVHKVYLEYEKNLASNNALDFDDILIKTLALLRIPKILEEYQEKYKYLMVDEYQDTNAPQYEIVKLLASKYKNLAVVGDDSQSIYSWRGADMRNIINFKKDYNEALIVKLEQNYRSSKKIIAGANSVIKNNTSGIKKELWTDNPEGDHINYIEAPDDKIEASIIAKIIKEKKGDYKDNLILYRTNAQSRKIEEALMINNIPYRVIGGQKFYDRKEIKDLLGYLRIIHNPNDLVSMKRIINTPTRKIGVKSIEILDNYKENFGLSYPQIIENIDELEELNSGAKNSIKIFNDLYKELIKLSKEKVVSELIKDIVKLTKYEDYLTIGLSKEEKESKLENIDELINVASEYNGMEPRESLSTFLEEVALITDMDKTDDRSDYVILMTVHTSKGLEEKRVFLTGLEDGIFPSFRSVNDTHALEEERRLMYVAMTRAREELYLSRAIERFNFGDYVRNPVSRFVKEIPLEYLVDYDLGEFLECKTPLFGNSLSSNNDSFSFGDSKTIKVQKKEKINNNISDFSRGDKVSHPKFGGGLITSLNGELAEIAFSGYGIKKMNIRIAPVRKI
ncbi:ATP-dependent DNA helicase PcrA [Candidatus Gracilibacteria bacterium]|nr:MAG: ATP-dependent DNA helicase PcrA [Candidatus Gracilibacteria bacterium]PIE85768.1 MAG: ATP-dependent DNA helicase PcrA [Candidatus Gracilibacteria bacterium]